jgi:hypothetical protein
VGLAVARPCPPPNPVLFYPDKGDTIMLRIAFIAVAAASSVACGIECSKDAMRGAYLVETTEWTGGTCGYITPGVQIYGEGEGDGCVLDSDVWSDDECKNERLVTCTSVADGYRAVGASVTEQQDSDGQEFTGTLTMTVYNLNSGATICVSTYDVTATKQ